MYMKRQLEKEVNSLTPAICKNHKPNFSNCENANSENFLTDVRGGGRKSGPVRFFFRLPNNGFIKVDK